jgi:hypothetical protein
MAHLDLRRLYSLTKKQTAIILGEDVRCVTSYKYAEESRAIGCYEI